MTRADWRVRVEPATFVWIALIAVLLFLVALPMTKLLIVSFTTRGGAFTFANYLTAYGRERYIEALVNSLLLASATTGYSILFAVPMAWAMSRTDMPGKGVIWLTVLGAFILPPPDFDPEPDHASALAVISAVATALRRAAPGKVVCLSTIGADAAFENLLSPRG